MIEETIAYVKDIFKNDYSGHDFSHTMRVYKMAVKLASLEGTNERIVALAALLHDVDDYKLSPSTYNTKEKADQFLRLHHVSDEDRNHILSILHQVSFEGDDSVIPDTLEGKCVQDADRLDALGAIGIARAFAYGGAHHRVMYDPDEKPLLHMDKDTYHNHISTTINHFYEKLFLLKDMMTTESGKKIAIERDQYMHDYIDHFLSEWM